jgi:hypothetical protein
MVHLQVVDGWGVQQDRGQRAGGCGHEHDLLVHHHPALLRVAALLPRRGGGRKAARCLLAAAAARAAADARPASSGLGGAGSNGRMPGECEGALDGLQGWLLLFGTW